MSEVLSRKTRERRNLADRICRLGVVVMPSCSYCRSKGKEYKVIPKGLGESGSSTRCSECVRRGRSCDIQGVPSRECR